MRISRAKRSSYGNARAVSVVAVRLPKLLEVVDYREQLIQRGADHLRVSSTGVDLCRLGRVYGELDPSQYTIRTLDPGSTTNDYLGVETLHLLPERLQTGSLHLGVRAQYPDGRRNCASVGAVLLLEGDQYLYLVSFS
jgi:hypothetical protein